MDGATEAVKEVLVVDKEVKDDYDITKVMTRYFDTWDKNAQLYTIKNFEKVSSNMPSVYSAAMKEALKIVDKTKI